jgi:hypothetical protein
LSFRANLLLSRAALGCHHLAPELSPGVPISPAAMPTTAIRIDTIRDLILDGYEISIHCRAYPCTNRVKADLTAVARKHGLDWEWFGQYWPYRCHRCGSHDVGMQLLPDVRPNSSPDRQHDLAVAKGLVGEIERERRRGGA